MTADNEMVERDIRIAIWNGARWQGSPQEVAQSLIQKVMDEPCMKRALAALSTDTKGEVRDDVERALAIAVAALGRVNVRCFDRPESPLKPIGDIAREGLANIMLTLGGDKYDAVADAALNRSDAPAPADTDDVERIAGIIGYHFAALVSGNNQPCMSGDPRDRLHSHIRRRFDDAANEAAHAVLAALRTQAPAGQDDEE